MSERVMRQLGRGLLGRCPNCGGRDLFRGWVTLRPACPSCGLLLDRGERDFFLGGYTLNFIAVELVLVLFLVVTVVLLWPDVPWTALGWGAATLMILAPIAFFPISRTLWLAIDLALRPAAPADFRPPSGTGERLS